MEELADAAADEPLAAAKQEIDQAIRQVYDDAAEKDDEASKYNQIVKPVLALLAERNRETSGRKIIALAAAPKHKRLRGKAVISLLGAPDQSAERRARFGAHSERRR